MFTRPLRLAIQAVTLAGVVVGTVAMSGATESIKLTVDGVTRTVHVVGDTVGEVLTDQGITLGEHDVVSPAPAAAVVTGDAVTVQFGRQVSVMVDGELRRFWTTARNVDEALRQAGLRLDGAQLSVSRSMPLGRGGLTMSLNTRKVVTLIVGGKETKVTTFAGTVGMLLEEQSLTLGDLDRLNPALTQSLVSGVTIQLDRVTQERDVREKTVKFTTKSTKTDDLDEGTTKITKKGQNGKARVTYLVTYVNGKRSSATEVDSEIISKPVTQEQQVGTREPDPRFPDFPAEVDNLNWAALADCESSGNPRAVNPNGHYGLYQFSLSTWESVGGSGNPIDASPDEQTARAKILYQRAGAGQWSCGSRLFT
ncbi:MAG: ubiquitin-like domain-containing protein [Actinomycetota bacterium]